MRKYLGFGIKTDANGYFYAVNLEDGSRFPQEGWSRSVRDLQDLIEEEAERLESLKASEEEGEFEWKF